MNANLPGVSTLISFLYSYYQNFRIAKSFFSIMIIL